MESRAEIRWEALAPTGAPAVADPVGFLEARLLASAEWMEMLARAAAAGDEVLLLVNDSHRATMTRAALAALGRAVGARGVGVRFGLLVATGTHRFDEGEKEKFLAGLLDGVGWRPAWVAWHAGTDQGRLVRVGHARFHESAARARWIAAIGSVEPHYFAGITGAHKTATIGIVSDDDIERNHAGALAPASDVLALDGNPVFDGIVEMLAGLQADGRTVVALDEVVSAGALVAAAAGEPVLTARSLLPVVRKAFVGERAEPADVVWLRVPWPLGRSLYQADKALKNHGAAVRDGGTVVLEAACPEGLGSTGFVQLLREAASYEGAVRRVRERGYRLGDHKAVKLRWLTDPAVRGVRVWAATAGLSTEAVQLCGFQGRVGSETRPEDLPKLLNEGGLRGLIVEDAGHRVTVVAGGGASETSKGSTPQR